MNSAVRRFSLFFLSLATLASCDDPSDLGLDLQDENLIGAQYTELAVEAGTVLQPDSILAFEQSRAILGGYQDLSTGNVKATTFTEVAISGTNLKFGTAPKLDSLTLTLDYDVIYGAVGQELAFEVHRLTEGFKEKASYFTNSTLPYESNVLGGTRFKPELVTKKDTATGKETSSYVLPTIKLDPAFGQELLDQSDKAPLKDQLNFVQFLKGLAIVPADELPRVMVGLNLGASKLTLHYKDGTDTTRKTHTFYLSGSGVRDFSRIEANRSGTALEGLQKNTVLPSEKTGGEVYVQSATELYAKLTIPLLDKLRQENGKIIINRAELVVPVKNGSTGTIKAPSFLAIYQANGSRVAENNSGNAVMIPADGSAVSPAILVYDSKKNQYTVNITSYVQNVLLEKSANKGFLLGPSTSVATKEIIPYRAILSNTADRDMKLRVYFSKLD